MAKSRDDPTTLRRERAGRYATGDGRFIVEQATGGWMVTDTEHTNELGLPLVRGPFATLDDARAALETARAGPAPVSELAARMAALPPARPSARGRTARRPAGVPARPPEAVPTPAVPVPGPPPPAPPPIAIRAWRREDGDGLRRLWAEAEMHAIGDDDASLETMARRNPGLLLVATAGHAIVGSALGAWDGRRGWIYHVATARDHRRRGIGRRLVTTVEERLRALGCRKVNVIVFDANDDGSAFWASLGYTRASTRQFGRELPE